MQDLWRKTGEKQTCSQSRGTHDASMPLATNQYSPGLQILALLNISCAYAFARTHTAHAPDRESGRAGEPMKASDHLFTSSVFLARNFTCVHVLIV